MKTAAKQEQFLTDANGKRIGVVLDLESYQRLREAAEELEEIRAYDTARPKVLAEFATGRFQELNDYMATRKKR